MYTKKLLLSIIFIMIASASFAQFHYKGMQAIKLEYGIETPVNAQKLDAQYTIGYHYFLGRNVYLEVNGQYEQRPYSNSFRLNFYDVAASYKIDNYFLNGTLNLTLLNIGNRIFLDIGVGPTTGMRFIKKVTEYNYSVNENIKNDYIEKNPSKSLPLEPNNKQGIYRDKWLIGVNAPVTLEIYLSRHFSILGRYRTKYLVRESTNKWMFDTTVGASIHF